MIPIEHIPKQGQVEMSRPQDEEGWDLVIRPAKGWSALNLYELWIYRELLYFLVWRNLKVRYKQTALGVAWAVIQPFLTMVVFSIFFGRLAEIPSDGVPYPIFAYAALVPWTYFSNSLGQAINSLVQNEKMITKIYFPRMLLPLATILSSLADFVIAFVILLGMMVWYGMMPTAAIFAIPLLVLLATLTAFGVSLWLSALNVQYRDVRYALAFLLQFWLFATPIAYPSSLVPEQWRGLYALNPMVGVVDGFRWALLSSTEPPGLSFGISAIIVMIILISGLFYFRKMEESFADII